MSSLKPAAPSAPGQGIWRDGKQLVVHKQAKLPAICVKTNKPSQRKIKRKFYWHSPAVFLAILLHIFIYIILAMVLRKKHELEVPVTEETAGKRRNWIAIGWVVGLGSIGLFIAAMSLLLQDNTQSYTALAVTGLVLAGVFLIAGCMVGSRAAAVLQPKKMTETATWFKGANSEYLKRFPPIPPNVQ